MLFFIANFMILLILLLLPDFFFEKKYLPLGRPFFFFFEIALFFSKGAFLGRPFFALFFFLQPLIGYSLLAYVATLSVLL